MLKYLDLPLITFCEFFGFSGQKKLFDSPRMNQREYQQAIGLLLYALRTRPDIAFATNTLSARSHECTDADMVTLKRIARYLHGTKTLGLRFECGSADDVTIATKLYAWCDASHASLSESKSQVGTISVC